MPPEFVSREVKKQRQRVFGRFSPWMNWMMPYFSVDAFRLQKESETQE